MRKILVLHRYPPKQVIGTNASFIQFLNDLSKENFDIFYLTYKDKSEKPHIKNLNYIFLPFYFDRGNNRDKLVKTIIWIFLTPFYVAYLQRKHRLDLVYCDDSVPYYGFLSKIFSPKSKVIIRLGDLQSGYSLADNHQTLFKLAVKLESFMWSKIDGIIAISKPFKKYIVDHGIPPMKVCVVEESINLDSATNMLKEPVINGSILFHGAIVKCKGLKVLIDAFKIFSSSHPKVKLLIAGGGSEENSLKRYVKSVHVDNISFTGWYNREKLEKIMKDVQISIVMRSPNTANNFVVTTCLLENWASRKPVIAPDLKAFKEVVKNKQNGIFFKTGDAEDLSNKIEFLYTNTSIYEKLILEGVKTAKKTFDHKKIASKMVFELKKFIS